MTNPLSIRFDVGLLAASRFPRGSGARTGAIVDALLGWLDAARGDERPDEEWLV